MRLTGALFLATLFCVTWEKVHWNVAGAVGIADVLTILFLAAFALEWGRPRFPRTTVVVLGIFAALLVVYLIGFFNIETRQSLDQWGKGMVKFVLHFLFLGAGVAYLARRSTAFYWRAVAAMTLGLLANGVYGVLQLLAARAGVNLDHVVLAPLTGGASSINVYGAIGGSTVYRPNALTGDPNHLAVMLCIPLLTLLPVYLRLERGNRLRVPLAVCLAFLFIAHLAVYDFVPQILHSHPLFGLGLNTFSVYYEFVTGKSNWGPHSFYVALIVETGLVGAVVFFVFLRYLFARLQAARAVGRALASIG